MEDQWGPESQRGFIRSKTTPCLKARSLVQLKPRTGWRCAAPAGRQRDRSAAAPSACFGCPSFIEHSFGAVEDLRERGFAVATFDWRSQGGSRRSLADTTKVHVRSFDEYQLDLQAFVSQGLLQDCPPPYYALAQSVGAAILLDGMDRELDASKEWSSSRRPCLATGGIQSGT